MPAQPRPQNQGRVNCGLQVGPAGLTEAELDPLGALEAGPEAILEIEAFLGSVGAGIVTGGDRTSHVPALGRVRMPGMARFESAEAAHATLAHDLAHHAACLVMPRGPCGAQACLAGPRDGAA